MFGDYLEKGKDGYVFIGEHIQTAHKKYETMDLTDNFREFSQDIPIEALTNVVINK
jgi:hypothetical protein